MSNLIELRATNETASSFEIEGIEIPAHCKNYKLQVTRSLADKLVITTASMSGISLIIANSNIESVDPLHQADKKIAALNSELEAEREDKARIEAEAAAKAIDLQNQIEALQQQLEAQQSIKTDAEQTPPAEKPKPKSKAKKSDETAEAK